MNSHTLGHHFHATLFKALLHRFFEHYFKWGGIPAAKGFN